MTLLNFCSRMESGLTEAKLYHIRGVYSWISRLALYNVGFNSITKGAGMVPGGW